MNHNIWMAFVIACIIFSSAPGVGIFFTVNNAMTQNIKYMSFAIAGLEFSLCIYLILIALGMGALISKSLPVFYLIKWFGVVYLIWLGIQKIRNPYNFGNNKIEGKNKNHRKAFISGMCVNLTNPKSIIFLAALLPQFIDISEPLSRQYVILGVTMISIDMLFHFIYGQFANKMKQMFLKDTWSGVLNKAFGVLFIGAGLIMARANK